MNPWLVINRASNRYEVPILSSVNDCIREMCTPRSLWIPEHSMQTTTPKLTLSHVVSKKKENVIVIQLNITIKQKLISMKLNHS